MSIKNQTNYAAPTLVKMYGMKMKSRENEISLNCGIYLLSFKSVKYIKKSSSLPEKQPNE